MHTGGFFVTQMSQIERNSLRPARHLLFGGTPLHFWYEFRCQDFRFARKQIAIWAP
jgi:hypothetical protein